MNRTEAINILRARAPHANLLSLTHGEDGAEILPDGHILLGQDDGYFGKIDPAGEFSLFSLFTADPNGPIPQTLKRLQEEKLTSEIPMTPEESAAWELLLDEATFLEEEAILDRENA